MSSYKILTNLNLVFYPHLSRAPKLTVSIIIFLSILIVL